MLKLLLLLSVAACASCAGPYKILFYSPQFSPSHVKFVGGIADFLVKAGHNVTVLMPKMSPIVSITGVKLAKIIFVPAAAEASTLFIKQNMMNDVWSADLTFMKIQFMVDAFTATCRRVNEEKELLESLKEENFDLMVAELFDGCAFVELLHIPAHVITCASSLMDNVAQLIGVPMFPSYVPGLMAPFPDKMTYIQRFLNMFMTYGASLFLNNILDSDTLLYRKLYGSNFTDLREVVAQTSFVLTNGEYLLDYPHPITHKVIEIAGLSFKNPQNLNKEWNKVLTARKRAILVSFGSNVQSCNMTQPMKDSFLKLFDEFPDVTFIWKYECDDLPLDKHKNLFISKWLPQIDILGHKSLVAFITHGGMNSLVETTRIGKPVVVIPLFGDQERNANLLERAGIGIKVMKNNLENHEVLHDAKAESMSRMIRKKPFSPVDALIRHVEFAAEFGRLPFLDPVGRTMPFYKYFLLDIIIPILLLVILIAFCILWCLYLVLRKFLRYVCAKKQKAE
uniref:glucuronosyltransferase n=1 Tax=Syphacia muris TaxID=451379 RepID=A0A0N5A983_9BILA